jgi:NADH dehydrogenase FAD-containing subunit
LKDVKRVVVVGGGPAAVEVAAEVAQEYNRPVGWFKSSMPKVEVLMLVRSSQLLNGLPLSVAKAAESQLQSLGVTVLYKTAVLSVSRQGVESKNLLETIAENITARTIVKTKNGQILDADLYIPATGVTPNTSFLPQKFLSDRGYVRVNQKTLQVDDAGPRVYAIGDCADYKHRDLLDLYAAIPVGIANLKRDIIQDTGKGIMVDTLYLPDLRHTQLIPIGNDMGVGLISGWFAPIWLV